MREASPTEASKIETGPSGTSPARTGRKTRQRPGQDRRHALVEAAYRRIAECGFEGLRLRDVAAEVGIDHSTIHHYFPTKQALVTAVVDYATRQFWTSEPHAQAAAEELRRQLARLARMIVERPELHIVVRELDLRARRDAEVRAVVASREEGWRASLGELLARGAPGGARASAVDPAVAGELLIAAVKGASLDPQHAVGALRH